MSMIARLSRAATPTSGLACRNDLMEQSYRAGILILV
jgi:hypothetical protein